MNKSAYIIIIAVCLIAAGLFFAFFEKATVEDINWMDECSLESKSPKSHYVFASLLEDKFGKSEIKKVADFNSYDLTDTSESVYLSLSRSLEFSHTEAVTLEKFINDGGTAVLIANKISFNGDDFSIIGKEGPPSFVEANSSQFKVYGQMDFDSFNYEHHDADMKKSSTFYYSACELKYYNQIENPSENQIEDNENFHVDTSDSNLIDTSLQNEVHEEIDSSDSDYIEESNVKNNDYIYIMKHDTNIVFSYIDIGKGRLILHVLPELFSNSASLQSFYQNHFNELLSVIGNKKHIIISKPLNSEGGKKNLLKEILNNKHLSSAYYLMLATVLVFFIFGAKRKQKSIPVKEDRINTSLEYLSTLSRLYEMQEQPEKLIGKMEDNFYAYVAKMFFIYKNEENFVSLLAMKTRVESDKIEVIIKKFNSIKKEKYCETVDVINIYKLIEQFKQKSNDRGK